MDNIQFSKKEIEIIVKKIKIHFQEKLNQEIGQFDAEFLLDFFSEEIGSYFYNRGLYDAQVLLTKKIDDICESICELEKPTDFVKK